MGFPKRPIPDLHQLRDQERQDSLLKSQEFERKESSRRTRLGLPPSEADAHFSDDPSHKGNIAPNAYDKNGKYNPNWFNELKPKLHDKPKKSRGNYESINRAAKAKPRRG